ncbi:MAG TPA: hypothetical protein VGM69_00260 [Chloroflexota bacterium]|jgi:hypothetical protein
MNVPSIAATYSRSPGPRVFPTVTSWGRQSLSPGAITRHGYGDWMQPASSAIRSTTAGRRGSETSTTSSARLLGFAT